MRSVLEGANARVRTGAIMTTFIHTRVPLARGLSVVIDGNSKITAGNGAYDAPTPNAFSLPAASVPNRFGDYGPPCPGSTPTCRASCYVRGLAKHAPDVYAAYRENAAVLDRFLRNTDDSLWLDSASALGEWIASNARGGFRWHVSGDVWNGDHAAWIVRVCQQSRDVNHWIYTRTLSVVPILMRAKNLAVNVSGDHDNYADARDCAAQNGARLAYMATDNAVPSDLPPDSIVFPDYPLRGRELAAPTSHPFWQGIDRKTRLQVCPADFFGQSEEHRCGPCSRCMKPLRA